MPEFLLATTRNFSAILSSRIQALKEFLNLCDNKAALAIDQITCPPITGKESVTLVYFETVSVSYLCATDAARTSSCRHLLIDRFYACFKDAEPRWLTSLLA